MHRKQLLTAMVLAVLCLAVPMGAGLAAVTLTSFTATVRDDGTILVAWTVATELETSGYRLYRSESPTPADWGEPVAAFAAGDGVSPQKYEYVDQANDDTPVLSGVRYYYLLEDISTASVVTPHGPVSAGTGLPTDTPTPTPTATASRAASATPRPAAPGIVLTDTPAPTATRQFTNTPVPEPSGTPLRGIQPTTPPIVQPTATPLPPASVNAPTATAPQAPAGAAPAPTAPAPAQAEAVTPAPQQVAVQPAGLASATPRPPRESTPVIFAASGASATPSPAAASQAAGPGGRNTGLAWVIGASAIALAGLVGTILLYRRSRKS